MHRRHREQQGLNAVYPPNIGRTRTVGPIDGIPATKIRPLTNGLIKPTDELGFIKAIGPFQDRIKVIHPQFSGQILRKLQSGTLAALLRPNLNAKFGITDRVIGCGFFNADLILGPDGVGLEEPSDARRVDARLGVAQTNFGQPCLADVLEPTSQRVRVALDRSMRATGTARASASAASPKAAATSRSPAWARSGLTVASGGRA